MQMNIWIKCVARSSLMHLVIHSGIYVATDLFIFLFS